MGFGASLAFIAIGAVMAFAVKWDVPGIDLQMIGWILIFVGAVGALLTGLYTRRPRDEAVETIDPDKMFLADGDPDVPLEPHVHGDHVHGHVHDDQTEVMQRRVIRREER